MLDLESEVMGGLGSIPTRGNILSLDIFFSRSKVSDANIGIIKKCCVFVKKPDDKIDSRFKKCNGCLLQQDKLTQTAFHFLIHCS